MVVIGCTILPHGCMVFDGDSSSSSRYCQERNSQLHEVGGDRLSAGCQALFRGCIEVSNKVSDWDPELIILHTPHGISLSGAAGIYLNDKAKGNALWNEEWADIEVCVDCDNKIANNLLKTMLSRGIKVDGISCFGATESPLRWGEVVPLWFLTKGAKNAKYHFSERIFIRSIKVS